jgi:glutamate/tyrosine decarboxylase-like PLP-dependent enzyme
MDRADSWATDGHKTLNVPCDCGIAFVRHADVHLASMSVDASYLQRDHDERNNGEWSPDFSRRARATPVYAVLRTLGRRGVARLVDGMCDRAQEFAEILGADSRAEVLNDVVFNQVLVRFGDSDEATERVTYGIQEEGTCWASATQWRGRKALRISVSNWATTAEDVERSAAVMLAQVPA